MKKIEKEQLEKRKKKTWVVAGVMLEYQGKFLLIQQAKGAFHAGKWGVPGGMVEPGISIPETVKKEVREETGLEVEGLRFLGVIRVDLKQEKPGDPEGLFTYFLYRGKAISGQVKRREIEIGAYQWLTLEELKNLPPDTLRPGVGAIIRRLEEGKEFPQEMIIEEID